MCRDWLILGIVLAWPIGVAMAAGERAVIGHVDQQDVERGLWTAGQLQQAGERLFKEPFTALDGAGRHGATGNASPTRRIIDPSRGFLRTGGPDANSCAGCHAQPFVGGAGDFVANVFAGTPARDFAVSIDPGLVAERGTTSMNGSGAIEMLAREMTRDLQGIRGQAVDQARRSGRPARKALLAKGVSFGHVTGHPNGSVTLAEVEGVDRDLVIRPWLQKGVVSSLRTFTVNALNQHHGMQARERFGYQLTGTDDFDRDGAPDELTEGDVTALVIFQAALNLPGRVLPADAEARRLVQRGEELFRASACARCHVPEMVLDEPVFSEPGPYNLEGTLRVGEVSTVFLLDLTRDTVAPRLERRDDGRAVVRAYTDLKRHRICDAERPHFCNENLVQGFAPTDHFLTKRLWDAGSTAPYGHRGDLTTLRDAILQHGGEAREARLRYEALDASDQESLLAFLRSLRILPPGSEPTIIEASTEPLPYRAERREPRPSR
jgi:mono/diheme cytochrome c family protein